MAGIIFGAKRGNNLCGNASDFACMVRRQRAENVEEKTKITITIAFAFAQLLQ